MEEQSELSKTVDKINDVYSYMFKDAETNDEKSQVAKILKNYKPEGSKLDGLNIDEIRNTAYATHEEAKAIVKRINAELDPVGFCPLRNNICRKDCVCFQPAFIQRFEAYHITGFMCDNKMFFGE